MPQEKIENAEIRKAVERAEKNHVHNWALELEEAYGGQFYCAAHCTICHLEMPTDETSRRLNATERLSAEGAKRQATEHDCMDDEFRASLFDYAAALEEE